MRGDHPDQGGGGQDPGPDPDPARTPVLCGSAGCAIDGVGSRHALRVAVILIGHAGGNSTSQNGCHRLRRGLRQIATQGALKANCRVPIISKRLALGIVSGSAPACRRFWPARCHIVAILLQGSKINAPRAAPPGSGFDGVRRRGFSSGNGRADKTGISEQRASRTLGEAPRRGRRGAGRSWKQLRPSLFQGVCRSWKQLRPSLFQGVCRSWKQLRPSLFQGAPRAVSSMRSARSPRLRCRLSSAKARA